MFYGLLWQSITLITRKHITWWSTLVLSTRSLHHSWVVGPRVIHIWWVFTKNCYTVQTQLSQVTCLHAFTLGMFFNESINLSSLINCWQHSFLSYCHFRSHSDEIPFTLTSKCVLKENWNVNWLQASPSTSGPDSGRPCRHWSLKLTSHSFTISIRQDLAEKALIKWVYSQNLLSVLSLLSQSFWVVVLRYREDNSDLEQDHRPTVQGAPWQQLLLILTGLLDTQQHQG